MDGRAVIQHTVRCVRENGQEADQDAVDIVRRRLLEAEVLADEEDVSGLCKNTLWVERR